MDPPPFKFPASPGTPLFPLSPERVNGNRSPYGGGHIAQSPSLPEFSTSQFGLKLSHSRDNSDANVQGMVARFNSLEIRDHKEIHRRDEVAIKRAEMAREMAEMELKKIKDEKEKVEQEARKWREEVRKLHKDIEDSRSQERKIAKRLEVAMDALDRSKEIHNNAQPVYEKEIRRMRKEAFKSSSALVKTQEELKATRNSLRITQSGLESEKMKLAKREQEAFTAQYQLVGVQEELDKAREKIKVVEEERDALKTSLKEEEVARIAAEGCIALPVATNDENDEFASPAKSPRKLRMVNMDGEDKENIMPRRAIELKSLQEELTSERRRRERAEDQIDFMKMECQFQCCSCRVAELRGSNYVHDSTYDAEMERIKATVPIITPPASDSNVDEMEGVVKLSLAGPQIDTERPSTPVEHISEEEKEQEPLVAFSPTTGTFRTLPPRAEAEPATTSTPAPALPTRPHLSSITEAAIESSPWAPAPDHSIIRTSTSPPPYCPALQTTSTCSDTDEEAIEDEPSPSPAPPSEPQTPAFHTRTITTTTTVPLHFSPAPTHNMPLTPSTISHLPSHASNPRSSQPLRNLELNALPIDREAALEQIRLRRGRARSMAAGHSTPRKQMLEGTLGRRDISAPVSRAIKR
ncbi:hypothetical protein AOQ84DRAFT_381595 [Glonium stellatum]|uniref:Uncharacterized protein n=1 Tax=Glonium stellatum TaxID=574774 RepID=A0A8E2JN94_9PEZI|nr:hypothetical protein AOQ84DRAFT_381595 [Glonium stellatum]